MGFNSAFKGLNYCIASINWVTVTNWKGLGEKGSSRHLREGAEENRETVQSKLLLSLWGNC